MTDITDQIKAAKAATIDMSVLSTDAKDRALEAMASALDSNRALVIGENRKDLDDARDKIPKPMYKRMVVDDGKIDEMVKGIRSVKSLKDPVGETMSALEMDDGLTLYQVRCPVGMLGVVFESRPDVVPQIMSLCLKSGNCVAFKGGSEAYRTIKAIFDILRGAAEKEGIPGSAFVLLESREDFKEILDMDGYIDLLIPRGSNSFVRYVQENTRIPVLGHAAGICHIFIDSECDEELALQVALDSKIQYPAVCNAVENILVDAAIAKEFLPKLITLMKENGVEVRADELTRLIVPDVISATDEDWYEEYDDMIIAIKVIDSLQDAIDFINTHSSHHTDAIITGNMQKASVFVKMVDSADVFVNASTRFADGYRFGKGAEVGISTNKIHARGPMGMEGLMIYKYVLIGNGQVVKDYVGKDAKQFKHIRLDTECPLR
jgi:glutamate-5-semialdehyde dehydrogenase